MTGSFALTLIAKATFIFIAGAALAALLRDSSASVRRSVWALTLAAAASLPIGMIATPAWRVAVLPSVFNVSNVANLANVKNVANIANVANGSAAAMNKGLVGASKAITPGSRHQSRSVTNTIASTKWLGLTQLIALVWLIGVAAVLVRILLGVVGLRSVTRRASNAAGESWDRIIRIERDRILPGRRVRVLVSGDVSTPLTFGAVTPVILLPEESETWSDEHRAVVMRHEMAHIATGDTAVCFGAAVACALYWFHPMAWVAAGRLRREQERACDDRVLEMGTPAADYATHLLEVARSARALGMPGFVSVAMARPSQLEGRLLAVLDEKGPRGTLTRAARVTAYAASAVVMLGVSALQLEARTAGIVTTFTGPAIVAPVEKPVGASETRSAPARRTTTASTESTAPVDSTIWSYVTVAPGGVLVLDLRTGAGVTIVGSDENIVRMRAYLGGNDWRNTDIRLTKTDDGAIIESRYINDRRNQSSSHRIEVSVPRRFGVRIRSAGGGLALRDVTGEFSGSTGGGAIRIDRARGSADLSTGGGSVSVSSSDLSGSVSTGGGQVIIQGVTGGLRGSSGTGDVYYGKSGQTITSAGSGLGVTDSDGKRIINKSGGSVGITSANSGASINTGGGAITVGVTDGDFAANTGGGDINVGTMRGNGDLSTGAGNVSVHVSGSNAHSVQVSSGNGKIILTLPPDISANFDIETAYTRDHGATRIQSDFTVPISETREWDDREGTPRRYVRAIGRVGSGQGRIKVRTINGDVVIRRAR
ncbi:MAG: M56 family metallopeptidase [Gemmatimonadales bacterium]